MKSGERGSQPQFGNGLIENDKPVSTPANRHRKEMLKDAFEDINSILAHFTIKDKYAILKAVFLLDLFIRLQKSDSDKEVSE